MIGIDAETMAVAVTKAMKTMKTVTAYGAVIGQQADREQQLIVLVGPLL